MSPPPTREIWVGESANLSSLRAGIQANSLNVALEQLLDESQEETVLLQVDSVQVNAVANDDYTYNAFDDDDDNDDDHDDDQDTSNSASSFWRSMAHQPEIGVTGLLIVTTLRILFCSTTTTASPQSTTTTIPPSTPYDFSIDAGCINLHALTNEPKASVFLQVEHDNTNNNNMDREGEPVDITLIPSDENQCPLLFEALSKLVSLHPIVPDDDGDDDDDDDDADDDGTSDLMTMMMMMTSMPRQTMGLGAEELGDDDPSDVEREAMLRRLDHLLVVPPELEIDEGQFEDADEALL